MLESDKYLCKTNSYQYLVERQNSGRKSTKSVKSSSLPNNIERHTTIFPKGVISEYTKAASATPRTGPTLLIVAAIMPMDSTTDRPEAAIKKDRTAKTTTYKKKKRAIPAMTREGTVLPFIVMSNAIEG